MNVNDNFTASVFRVLMVLTITYAIIIQPMIDSNGGGELTIYEFLDLEEEPNSNENNTIDEILKDTKIGNQYMGNSLNDCIEINKKSTYYRKRIISDSNLEIHITPPDFS
jgi:hypothetical protein